MAFLDDVNDTPSVSGCGNNGLGALTAAYKRKVRLENPRLCEGSLNIDEALRTAYPNDNRWDYAIGYNGRKIFMEVHPAITSEVSTVIAKLQWLMRWLKKRDNQLGKNIDESSFHWISTNGCSISPQSKHARQLALTGIALPKAQLHIQ